MKISAWKKITLIFSGLILSLALLEVGLRLGGVVLQSMQERGNLQSAKQKGAYRILCLGESTTQGQYPHLLEKVLNQRNIGVRFSVIDKGKTETKTPFILSHVESYLAEYHSDMVVAMMGINDQGVKYYEDIPKPNSWLFRHYRTYRFGRILYMHLLNKLQKRDIYGPGRTDSGMRAKPKDAETLSVKSNLSNETSAKKITRSNFKGKAESPGPRNPFINSDRMPESEESLKKAIEFGPTKDPAYVGLGRLYQEQGKFSQAEDCFKKAIEINPENDIAYLSLGALYRAQYKLLQAEDCFKKAIEINPGNDMACFSLGRLYDEQGKPSQAEVCFKKTIEINPGNDMAYLSLGAIYRGQGELLQAEGLFKKAVELNPTNTNNSFHLVALLREQGKLLQAESVLKKASEFRPKNDSILAGMASLYEEMGNPELAKEYTEKTNRMKLETYPLSTVNNYRKLKEILDRKGIKLVCVQYPMRGVDSLKSIFGKDKGVIFVDNEQVFREAVKRSSYKEYFRDMFAGDFGHCTQKGNMLDERQLEFPTDDN